MAFTLAQKEWHVARGYSSSEPGEGEEGCCDEVGGARKLKAEEERCNGKGGDVEEHPDFGCSGPLGNGEGRDGCGCIIVDPIHRNGEEVGHLPKDKDHKEKSRS